MKEDCAKCILSKSVMYGLTHPTEYYNPYTDSHNQSQQWWTDADRAKPMPDIECLAITEDQRIYLAHIVAHTNEWNIPNVKFWRPYDPTKEIEQYFATKVRMDRPLRDMGGEGRKVVYHP